MTRTVHNKRITIIFTIAGLLLMIPFIAMLFTNEVKWSIFDFMIAAVLLSGTGLAIEFVLRRVTGKLQRIVLCGVVLVVLLLVWAELAVGIFGTPWAGN